MPSVTCCSVLPSLLLWHLPRRCPIRSLTRFPGQPTFTSPPGPVATLLHWTCTSSPLFSSRAWERQPPSLQVGVQRKLTTHLAECRFAGVDFVPIVVEALGGLAEDSVNVIRVFGEAIALRVGPQDSATCTKQLFHRVVAMALWRDATLWLHRQPSPPPPLWTVYCSVCVCVLFWKNKKKVAGRECEGLKWNMDIYSPILLEGLGCILRSSYFLGSN